MASKPNTILKSAHFLGLMLITPVLTQFIGEDKSRNCTANETLPHPSGISYQTLNASGSFDFPGLGENQAPWTWSTGVQNVYQKGRQWYQQPIWVDTHGIDLASDDLGFQMCVMALLDQPQSVQQRGHGDDGDCMKFLSEDCVKDWKFTLNTRAAMFMQTNSTAALNATTSPCRDLDMPKSCKEFSGLSRIYDVIPSPRRKCPLGLGSPDYDAVLTTAYVSDMNETLDTSVYDKMTTAIVPVFALAWSETARGGGSGWTDSRIMCLSTPNTTEGSRKAAGVPNASVRLELNLVYVLIGSVMLLVITS